MQHREVHAPHLPFLNQSPLIMPVALMSENVYEVASTSARRTGTFKATTSSTATTTAGAKTAATLHTHSRISRTRQAADHSSCATFKVLLFFCCYFCFVCSSRLCPTSLIDRRCRRPVHRPTNPYNRRSRHGSRQQWLQRHTALGCKPPLQRNLPSAETAASRG
jgi:hypothetical protein